MPPARPIRILLASAVLVLASCAGGSSESGPTSLGFVGRIPGVNGSAGAIVVDGVRADLANLQGPVLASKAAGNRLLVIGDSILAGTASRYGGAMCSTMVPLGWRVAVEAEAGKPVGFGRQVLQARIYDGWDAAVVFLGTNYGGDPVRYAADLTRIVESLAPRPVLLLTATMYKPVMADVNREIRSVAARFPDVSVLDWSATSTQPGLLNGDGIHPNNTGRTVLVASIASAVGRAPGSGSGACLPSMFTDDSQGDVTVFPTTTTLPGSSVTTTTIGASPTSTAAGARPGVPTTTTVAG